MKKLISLFLTLALLSTLFVVGTTTASAATPTVEKEYAPTAAVRITRTWNTETEAFDYTLTDLTSNSSTSNIIMPINENGDGGYMAYKIDLTNVGTITSAQLTLTASKVDNGGNLIAYECSGTWEDLVNGVTTPVFGDVIKSISSKSASAQVSRTIDITTYLAEKQAAEAEYAIVYVAQEGTGTPRGDYNGGFRLYQLASSNAPVLTVKEEVEGLSTKILVEKTKTVYLNDAAVRLSSEGEKTIMTSSSTSSTYVNYVTAATDGVTATTYPFYRVYYLRGDISDLTGKEIVSAELSVYGKKYRGSAYVRAYKTSSDWNTTDVTYATAPATDAEVGYKTLSYKTSEAYNTADVTSFINSTDEKITIKLQLYHNGNYNHKQGATVKYAGYARTEAPKITITYLDEIDTATETLPAGKTFTFKGETSTTGAAVRLVVALYEGETFLGAVASDVLTNGEDTLELPVDLSAYSTATKVKCYFWDGTTLVPFMEPTPANVAAATE